MVLCGILFFFDTWASGGGTGKTPLGAAVTARSAPRFSIRSKIPLLKGRYLDEHDTKSAPWAIVINETMAQKYFPNANPIGRQIVLRFDPYPVEVRRRQIVGVVGDVKQYGLGRQTPPFIYGSYLQHSEALPGGATRAHPNYA